jgi:hypothetical protein
VRAWLVADAEEAAAVAGRRFFACAEARERGAGDAGTALGADPRTAGELGKGFGVWLFAGGGLLLGVGVGAELLVRLGEGDGDVVVDVVDGFGLGVGEVDVGRGVGEVDVGRGVGDPEVGQRAGDADFGLALGDADFGLALGDADFGLALGDADFGLALGDADFGLALGEADFGLSVGEADVGQEVGDADVRLGLGDADVALGLGNGLTDAAAAATGKNATVPATRRPAMATRPRHATRRPLAIADLGRPNLVLGILTSKVTVAPAPSFREPPEAD